jgi:ATP-dependent Clp protease ATP-binding subunit ClpC
VHEARKDQKMMIYGLPFSVGRLLDWIWPEATLREKANNVQMNERGRFEKFTRRARNVLSFAQEEAQRLRHNSIGTEHLLLGLVREGEGVAGKVLTSFGVDLKKVRRAVEDSLGRGSHIVLGEIGLTPHAKTVIELTIDEARHLNHHYIGTEHLLLGLLREGEGREAGVLESFGLSSQEVRAKTLQILNEQRQ